MDGILNYIEIYPLMIQTRILRGAAGVLAFALLWGVMPVVRVSAATIVSVKDAGAKGDGVTDDSAAFQQAINGLPAAGGTVFIPAGTYRIAKPIRIDRDNVALLGVGNETNLQLGKSDYNTLFMIPSLENNNPLIVHNISFSRLRLDGNKVCQRPLSEGAIFGVWVGQAENVLFSEIYANDWAYEPFTFANGHRSNKNITMDKVHIKSATRNGFHFGQGQNLRANLVHVEDSPSQNCQPAAGHGLDIEQEGSDPSGVAGAVIENSLFERENTETSGAGVALQPAYGPITDVVIRKTLIRNHQGGVGAIGLWENGVSRVRNVTVEGNWIIDDETVNMSRNMFTSEKVDTFTAKNNVFTDYRDHDNYSVWIENSKNVLFENNRIYRPYCTFSVTGGSQNVTITGTQYVQNNCFITGDAASGVVQSGNTTVSASSVDKTAPTVSMGVQAGQVFSASAQVTVTASDAGVGVDRIMYFVDGIPQGVIDAASGSFVFDATRYQNGAHTLSVRAWDKSGNITSAKTVSVQVAVAGATPTPTPVPTTTPTPTPTPISTVPTPTPTPVASPTPAPVGGSRLVNMDGTYYLIRQNARYGVTSPALLWTHGFDFADAVTPTAAERLLAAAGTLAPGDGSLVKTASDPTVWILSEGRRRGFASESVFTALGFRFASVLTVTAPELAKLSVGSVVQSTASAHPDGLDIIDGKTIYWLSGGKRHPYPSMAVYNTWHKDNDMSQVVPANAADRALPVGEPVVARVVR